MFELQEWQRSLERVSRNDRSGFRLLAADFPKIAKRLQVEVQSETFAFYPLQEFHAFVGGKRRTLYRAEPLDSVVHFALAHQLTMLSETHLSNSCHSYRRGRSSQTALRKVNAFIRRHCHQLPDPRARGLYVIRTDIVAYGESIRTDQNSPLWPELKAVCSNDQLFSLLRAAIRQPIERPGGRAKSLDKGIPAGIPIQPPLNNLYLSAVDHELTAVEDLFYARFGDDILLMHPEQGPVETAFRMLQNRCLARGLTLSDTKTTRLFVNGPGRGCNESFRGAPHFDYLGARVSFSEGLKPRPDKLRSLFRRIRARIQNVFEAQSQQRELSCRGEELCMTLHRILDPSDPLHEPLAILLLGQFSDHRTCAEFYRSLELILAETLTRRRGRRAFRLVPPHRLRLWGMPSVKTWSPAGQRL